ncbi:MAG TPA: DUF3617 domain-containing protein [Terriglobales bacterium]|nr:DUF3617 domain-containing protein [Terriglobales bacterium]
MRIHIFGTVILALSFSLWAASKIQPLNVKTGLWQTTMTMNRFGEMPLPSDMLSRLTPQQRARLEARMKAHPTNTRTMVYKSCLTRKELENPNFTARQQCTWTTLQSNGARIKGSALCTYPQPAMRVKGSGEFVALDREHVKGFLHMAAAGKGGAMNTSSDFSSKWLGPSCGNLK